MHSANPKTYNRQKKTFFVIYKELIVLIDVWQTIELMKL